MKLWDHTKATMPREEWIYWLCRRADFSVKLWPANRDALYEAGLTIR